MDTETLNLVQSLMNYDLAQKTPKTELLLEVMEGESQGHTLDQRLAYLRAVEKINFLETHYGPEIFYLYLSASPTGRRLVSELLEKFQVDKTLLLREDEDYTVQLPELHPLKHFPTHVVTDEVHHWDIKKETERVLMVTNAYNTNKKEKKSKK
jgi:hypothetical protein